MILPFNLKKPDFTSGDALDDLRVALGRVGTFMGEGLAAGHIFEQQVGEPGVIRPVLYDWFTKLYLKKDEPLECPDLVLAHPRAGDIRREFPRLLYHASLTQLVTHWERYVASIAEEVYSHQPELLAIEERQLTSREVLECVDLAEVRQLLMQRALSKLTMASYPNVVRRFADQFHIDIHGDDSPLSLFRMHHLVEQRNVVVHGAGFVSKQYADRMSSYEHPAVLKEHQSIRPDFKELFDELEHVWELGQYVDRKVSDQWDCTARDYERRSKENTGESPS